MLNDYPYFGQWVECSAYIKKSGNNYFVLNDGAPFGDTGDYPMCSYWEKGATEGVAVEEYHECDRFVVVEKPFTGVYVGTTTLNTKISADYIAATRGVQTIMKQKAEVRNNLQSFIIQAEKRNLFHCRQSKCGTGEREVALLKLKKESEKDGY